jgi:hypothetical protein
MSTSMESLESLESLFSETRLLRELIDIIWSFVGVLFIQELPETRKDFRDAIYRHLAGPNEKLRIDQMNVFQFVPMPPLRFDGIDGGTNMVEFATARASIRFNSYWLGCRMTHSFRFSNGRTKTLCSGHRFDDKKWKLCVQTFPKFVKYYSRGFSFYQHYVVGVTRRGRIVSISQGFDDPATSLGEALVQEWLTSMGWTDISEEAVRLTLAEGVSQLMYVFD